MEDGGRRGARRRGYERSKSGVGPHVDDRPGARAEVDRDKAWSENGSAKGALGRGVRMLRDTGGGRAAFASSRACYAAAGHVASFGRGAAITSRKPPLLGAVEITKHARDRGLRKDLFDLRRYAALE